MGIQPGSCASLDMSRSGNIRIEQTMTGTETETGAGKEAGTIDID